MRTASLGYRDASSIPGAAVPALVDDAPPLTDVERAIVACINGLRTVDQIADATGDPESVRALIVELVWHRAVVISEVMTASELDEYLSDPAPFALRRRRRNSDSPLVRAVVALCSK